MKQLKSTHQDLRLTFSNVQAKHICEIFQSVPEYISSVDLCQDMNELDFDVMGVHQNGSIIGYVNKIDLETGDCSDHMKQFKVSELISESTPIIDCISLFKNNQRLFVLERNQVTGIITRGDLQKTPIRMHLFGYISLVEMQLQRIIEKEYPSDLWKKYLRSNRIHKAETLLAQRRKRNESLGLLDCLQFCDKRVIMSNIDRLHELMIENDLEDYTDYLRKIEDIRNNIAHSQDIIDGTTWDSFFFVVEKMDTILSLVESFSSNGNVK